ncbi:peptidoglycan endopeptidase [Allopontixanthobacter sp.]|uniref:peptidoglycan endopeptidase n=1 Tax=Allopontixanthobacter sp. TaxID=2906452 RepID=UPI002ABA4FFF|nr:peptidoglycan endopeptidase [Allopontixanthobacter sp.]MDZ4308365.1 peptidoglycan endopeptidase [Allopontixanthobacter sp.]
MKAASLSAAAARFIGAPFRLYGRDPASGLDCVGLVAAALSATGRMPLVPHAYALRVSDIGNCLEFASANGFREASGPVAPDDLILVRPGPAQFHLLIAEHRRSFIHAHAGLRRVVRMPGPLGWPVDRHWYLSSKD